MRICFPVEKNAGFDSELSGHFGSTPSLIVVDTTSREITELPMVANSVPCGTCATVRALGRSQLDALVVGAIGASALKRLYLSGLKVYQARSMKLAENLNWLASEELSRLRPGQGIGIHGHGPELGMCCGL